MCGRRQSRCSISSLLDTFDLYTQTKQAHWNVKGSDFHQLHLLFDAHAAHVVEWIDQVAERAVMLGGYATGTARMSATNSKLPEYPTDVTLGMDHVKALVERWGDHVAPTRAGIDTTDEWGEQGHGGSPHGDLAAVLAPAGPARPSW